MISVQLYIKKNTPVISGSATESNTSPFLSIKNSSASYTTNQFVGHYIKITKGVGQGSISWITSNTSTVITLQKAIQINTGSEFTIYRSDYQKLDLFKDEKISITSQLANVNDIGKVFTDFTQSFTIPASPRNNKILSHWYESSIDDGFDHRVRYDGYIEIDTQRFKDGNLQLEKASKKNGFIDSYTVTFYGNLTQLKDIIQDDKLSSLDFSIYNHTWDDANVQARIESATTTGDIKYPLIGSKRKYYYKDSTHSSEDVTTSQGAIHWNELFPAIKVSNIFLRIKAKYGIDFTGSFLNEDQWKKLYLYLKPSTELNFLSQSIPINFTSVSGSSFPEMNLPTDTLSGLWDFSPSIINRSSERYIISLTVTPSSGYTGVPYTVYVYKNGSLFTTLTDLVGTTTNRIDQVLRANDGDYVHKYTFSIAARSGFGFTTNLGYDRIYFNYTALTYVAITSNALSSSQSITLNIQIGNYMPDMKITDFLNGIVKAFNLMIIPKGNNVFDLSHLEMYYNAGKIMDITQYVYSNEMEIERPKLFKSINLTYETSTNVLNNAYKGLWGTEYGDLIYKPISSNESSSYDIKLPFENVLFERVVGEQFETATIVDKDMKPYVPKPMLIYCNGISITPLTGGDRIKLVTTSGVNSLAYYNRFSNEYDSFPTDTTHVGLMTMNFGNEQSPWYGVLAPKGLYYRHYKNYIDNLYNIKTRIVKVKAILPPSLISSSVLTGNNKKIGIELNDRLVIRNKRYIINNMTTDLTTGETNLELITDYRGIDAANSVGYRFATVPYIQTDKEALDFEVNIYLNDYDSFIILPALDYLVYTTTGLHEYQDLLLSVSIPSNTPKLDRYDSIRIEYYKNGSVSKTEYLTIFQTAL
ncbi:hypothetical protein UFOVP531_14 [uncultured Caudovirales phage]|uniref:Uncharacterized protein n=1 Tax=uncultured Caudovirales phage TaxID=2100421 RepID=A0A6J5MPQ4_9CAUD|nr:hypothetical protein UFOVP531_14 [uncultured Caudovirales phage]